MVVWRDRVRIDRDAPKALSILLGVWLFVSVFLWPHTHVQMTNTWITGALVVIFASLQRSRRGPNTSTPWLPSGCSSVLDSFHR
jgi:hypothetical protein